MSATDDWARCKPMIEAALEYSGGTHTIEDIEAGIAIGDFQFWAGKNSAVITEIIKYPRMSALNYFLIGGNLEELLNTLEPVIVEFAKFIGCQRIEGRGRKGWERVAASKGYANGQIVMSKGITQ